MARNFVGFSILLLCVASQSILSLPLSDDLEWFADEVNVTTIAPVKPANTTVCKGQKEGTFIPDAHNHSIYYECTSHGLAYEFVCPHGLIFVLDKKACQFDPNGVTIRPPDHGTSKFDCTGKKDGYYADPENRHKFHRCTAGYPSDFDCPPTTAFDPVSNSCIFDTHTGPDPTQPPTVAPTQPPTTHAPATAAPATTVLPTQPPTTHAPATAAPATTVPPTQPPTTHAPATAAPATTVGTPATHAPGPVTAHAPAIVTITRTSTTEFIWDYTPETTTLNPPRA